MEQQYKRNTEEYGMMLCTVVVVKMKTGYGYAQNVKAGSLNWGYLVGHAYYQQNPSCALFQKI